MSRNKSKTDLIIRPATPDDAAGIAKVHVDTWHTTYRGIVSEDFLKTLSYEKRAENFVKMLQDTQKFAFAAVDRKEGIVGFASGGPERGGDPEYTGELYAVYILKAHQKRGIGRKLVSAVAGKLRESGYRKMMLWVLADNSSKHFYESIGGVEIKRKNIEIGGEQFEEIAFGYEISDF